MGEFLSLEGRTIVVTGAGKGIGRATAELSWKLGANVAALDVDVAALDSLASVAPEGRLFSVAGSVTDHDAVARTVSGAVSRFGAVHGLVNNAGITRPAMIDKMTVPQWNEVIAVHLTGAFYCLQEVTRHMIGRFKEGDASGGSIVNVSSVAGQRGAIGQLNYAAAKAGLIGMTMTTARELGRYNVRANSVCFGVVETEMTEVIRSEKFRDRVISNIALSRWSSVDEVVKSICFLLSDASSYVTGEHLRVDGGFHISA